MTVRELARRLAAFDGDLWEQVDEESFNGLILSESSLAGDWLNKEEDEAWKDL